MTDVVIASAARTPVGKFQGDLASLEATDLGAVAVEAVLDRTGVPHDAVDEVVVGQAIQAGAGQNPARQAALEAGLPETVAAYTLNKVCGSSLKAVMAAAQAIQAGDAECLVAGGQESMTNAPHLLPGARRGYTLGGGEVVDSMQYDGLRDPFNDIPMGETGEIVAEEYGIDREAADELAERSHRRAAKALENGWFKSEIVPVETDQGAVAEDEGVRPDTDADALANLPPVFREDGVVTAGNASQISDGGSASLVASRSFAEEHGLPVQARVVEYGTSGVAPERVMAAPLPGVRDLLDAAGMTIDDIDLFEHNEAFATASCTVQQELDVPDETFNVHGGAVALGHPLGATGTRILATLLHALETHGEHRGLLTMCLGGGNAVQMIVERE